MPKFVLTILCLIAGVIHVKAQTIPPSQISVIVEEAIGFGCHDTTNHLASELCFDVMLKVDQAGWALRSYNIWMDYGQDSSVLSYLSDKSCRHLNGGAINWNEDGKYRFLASNGYTEMPANEYVNIHNFCLRINNFIDLQNQELIPGGQIYSFVSSLNLTNINDHSDAISPVVPAGQAFDMKSSSFLVLDPGGNYSCDSATLFLTADATDATGPAVMDCEPYLYMWEGPNGFQETQGNVSVTVTDPVAQSGVYGLHAIGANGCYGYQSFNIDIGSCIEQPSCIQSNVVTGPASIYESEEASATITTQYEVSVANNLSFNAPQVILNAGFTVPLGVLFETGSLGCE